MAKEKNKNVIIIGANSFSAGSLILLLLKKNYKVFGFSRSKLNKRPFLRFNPNDKKFNFFQYDVNKDQNKMFKIINKVKPSCVLNYACQSMVDESWDNPNDWFYTNSFSTIKLYNNISKLKFKIKLIHISTPEVYGSTTGKITEDYQYNPNSPYATSRVAPEFFLNILQKRNKINYCSIRASNVYGECQRLYRIIPRTIYYILKRKKIRLEDKGRSKRNFIHIDDVSQATYYIMKKGNNGEIYHVCGDKFIFIKDLVKLICNKMNYNFNNLVTYSAKKLERDKFYHLSNKKIKQKFNWNTKISIDTGIDRSIESIQNNLKSFSNLDENYHHKK